MHLIWKCLSLTLINYKIMNPYLYSTVLDRELQTQAVKLWTMQDQI